MEPAYTKTDESTTQIRPYPARVIIRENAIPTNTYAKTIGIMAFAAQTNDFIPFRPFRRGTVTAAFGFPRIIPRSAFVYK